MKIKSPEEVINYLENITYRDTQLQSDGVDLTVNKIYKITSSGSVDFGGGEYGESDIKELTPKKRSPDDKYGWWTLSQGQYLIKYNEDINIPADVVGIIQPKSWLIRNGCHHLTLTFTRASKEEIVVVLLVGDVGIEIKENARLSKLTVLEG